MLPLISDCFFRWHVAPEKLDHLLANGWRRAGTRFYRYSVSPQDFGLAQVQPLRVLVKNHKPSKSQRRIMRRNADLTVNIGPPVIDKSRRGLFDSHKERFLENAPDSLEDYLGPRPGACPCETREVTVREKEKLLAASYLDVGCEAVSSVYAMFDLSESHRSLGIFTMLLELEYARQRGCRYLYPGYAFLTPSHYDYKKRFAPAEWFDWKGNWLPLPGPLLDA